MSEQNKSDDYDSPWKNILESFFEEFMLFFFPDAEKDIDWSHGHEFWDKELQQVVRDADLGRRYADKLVRVWLNSGEEKWVLVHIEIQGQKDMSLSERMFVYNYRCYYGCPMIWKTSSGLKLTKLRRKGKCPISAVWNELDIDGDWMKEE